jgi:hypothetical protein
MLMALLFLAISVGGPSASAASDTLGEIRFRPDGDIEKRAGVWVDGQYVGYVSELKGSDKLLLLPGRHEITIRHSGYAEFSSSVIVEPGKTRNVPIKLRPDPRVTVEATSSEIKLVVKPRRAAVFLNDGYVGHVDEFDGPGQSMVLPPGKYKLKITLPGYQPLETEITLVPNQKFELKTDLSPGSIMNAGPPLTTRATPDARRPLPNEAP